MGSDKEVVRKRLLSVKTKPKYYIHNITGEKYPYYHPNWDNHPSGTVRYCNFGSGDRGSVKDLPKDGYPYSIEYDEPKLPKWWRD
jgi:hypothetical protein